MMHTPGLRLCMPGTVSDAYHLLRDAMRQPDPVVFIEHKGLYTMKGEIGDVPDAPWGQPAIRRRGGDLTIASYSRMLQETLTAAEALAPEIETEVVDLRCLNPLDDGPLMDSVRRTGRCLIVTEAVTTCSVASEIAARVSEQCFDWLEEPPLRLGGEDIPIPVSPALERASIPDARLIEDVARWLVAREAPSWVA